MRRSFVSAVRPDPSRRAADRAAGQRPPSACVSDGPRPQRTDDTADGCRPATALHATPREPGFAAQPPRKQQPAGTHVEYPPTSGLRQQVRESDRTSHLRPGLCSGETNRGFGGGTSPASRKNATDWDGRRSALRLLHPAMEAPSEARNRRSKRHDYRRKSPGATPTRKTLALAEAGHPPTPGRRSVRKSAEYIVADVRRRARGRGTAPPNVVDFRSKGADVRTADGFHRVQDRTRRLFVDSEIEADTIVYQGDRDERAVVRPR